MAPIECLPSLLCAKAAVQVFIDINLIACADAPASGNFKIVRISAGPVEIPFEHAGAAAAEIG